MMKNAFYNFQAEGNTEISFGRAAVVRKSAITTVIKYS